MILDPADLIAIRRAADNAGREAAMIELRRRFLAISDADAPAILNRLLAMPVDLPPRHAGHGEPHRDKHETKRSRKS